MISLERVVGVDFLRCASGIRINRVRNEVVRNL